MEFGGGKQCSVSIALLEDNQLCYKASTEPEVIGKTLSRTDKQVNRDNYRADKQVQRSKNQCTRVHSEHNIVIMTLCLFVFSLLISHLCVPGEFPSRGQQETSTCSRHRATWRRGIPTAKPLHRAGVNQCTYNMM